MRPFLAQSATLNPLANRSMLIAAAEAIDRKQQARLATDRDLWTRVRDSNLGVAFGWTVEADGVPMAYLTDPAYADMFWTSYAIAAVVQKRTEIAHVRSHKFWKRDDLVYRNRTLGLVAPF